MDRMITTAKRRCHKWHLEEFQLSKHPPSFSAFQTPTPHSYLCFMWKNTPLCIIAGCFLSDLNGLISPTWIQNEAVRRRVFASLNPRLESIFSLWKEAAFDASGWVSSLMRVVWNAENKSKARCRNLKAAALMMERRQITFQEHFLDTLKTFWQLKIKQTWLYVRHI